MHSRPRAFLLAIFDLTSGFASSRGLESRLLQTPPGRRAAHPLQIEHNRHDGRDGSQGGVRLDFLMSGGNYITVQPTEVTMTPMDVPAEGISLVGQMYEE